MQMVRLDQSAVECQHRFLRSLSAVDGGGIRGDGHLFQAGCPGRLLNPGILPASNVDLTTAPFRVSPDSTARR